MAGSYATRSEEQGHRLCVYDDEFLGSMVVQGSYELGASAVVLTQG